jgi:Holliday junction resolvase RusA-like endonuclease
MEFTFNHTPPPKKRPRFGATGKVYDPQREKSLAYKWEAARQMRVQSAERALESPVFVNMRFHMPMPKSWSEKRKKEQFGKPMGSKPDIDNLMKWSLDVLNGIAYVDDRLVSSTYSEKVWDYEGKVDISIQEQEMSLLEEIKIMGHMAVKMHEALDYLYNWALDLKKNYPSKHQIIEFATTVIDKSLEGGLDEIYKENYGTNGTNDGRNG